MKIILSIFLTVLPGAAFALDCIDIPGYGNCYQKLGASMMLSTMVDTALAATYQIDMPMFQDQGSQAEICRTISGEGIMAIDFANKNNIDISIAQRNEFGSINENEPRLAISPNSSAMTLVKTILRNVFLKKCPAK